MALIIEDGTGLANANSYVTDDEFTDFAAERGITIPGDAPARELLLIEAMDYLETLDYVGDRYSYDQALQWPRVGVSLHGYSLNADELPRELKKAQIQLAIDAQEHDLLPTIAPATTGAVIEETVEGAVSVKYAQPGNVAGDTATGAQLTRAMAILRPLLRSGSTVVQLRVGRG